MFLGEDKVGVLIFVINMGIGFNFDGFLIEGIGEFIDMWFVVSSLNLM